nr:TetR/AcrR family transcriptional regulator [Leucobacter luti]
MSVGSAVNEARIRERSRVASTASTGGTAGAGGAAHRPARRYGAELDEAIRAAVRDELAAGNYAGVTFEGVAKRAKTSKHVIYRRYPSRAHMVIDAWIQRPPAADSPATSSGDLRTDLLRLGRSFSDQFERAGVDTLRGLLGEIPGDQVHRLATETQSWVIDSVTAILDAARERGDIAQDPLPPHVVSLPVVLVRHELLFSGGLDSRTLTELIDTVLLPLLTAGTR